ncbi:MAG: prolipoprotein diacylglyceryl transferase, partial [Oscillospiraceae bacterium]
MTETLSFPTLGLSFDLNRVAFTIGTMPVYWYGIMIAIGFLLGMLYVFRRGKEFGIEIDRFIDVIFVSTIGAIIGARAYYVAFKWDYYSQNLSEIFNLRNGGIAIYGGIIGAFLVGCIMCKVKKVKVLAATDIIVGGFFIGQCIGRWGNFFNIEAFGGNTSLPWGMTSSSIVNYLAMNKTEL